MNYKSLCGCAAAYRIKSEHVVNETCTNIDSAYSAAIKFVKEHYENFPVISFLIPVKLQEHIAIIYWFARTADDLADEGYANYEERLFNLNSFEDRLTGLLNGKINNQFELALSNTINVHNLSSKYFYDLLFAFKQDVTKKKYESFEEVLLYCKHSANPVGRLMLELFGINNTDALVYSDNVCTALQLTNFYQDLSIDLKRKRIYLPVDELKKFNVTEEDLYANTESESLKQLLAYNVNRTERMFEEGRKLLAFLHGKLKLEIHWTILGGEAILRKIKKNDFNVLYKRPELGKIDFIKLFLTSFLK